MIRVNDRLEVAWRQGLTVQKLLEECGYTYPLVVVSINQTVVPREEYDTTEVPEGAQVRVLHLVAGG